MREKNFVDFNLAVVRHNTTPPNFLAIWYDDENQMEDQDKMKLIMYFDIVLEPARQN